MSFEAILIRSFVTGKEARMKHTVRQDKNYCRGEEIKCLDGAVLFKPLQGRLSYNGTGVRLCNWWDCHFLSLNFNR